MCASRVLNDEQITRIVKRGCVKRIGRDWII